MLGSVLVADSVISQAIDKVLHIKYMQEVDKKITPHTIRHTIIQSLKMVEENEMVKDLRIDDKYITSEY